MINLKPTIYELLYYAIPIDRDQINTSYPQDWSVFPIVQFTEEQNKTHIKCDGKERIAYFRYRIDIWDEVSTTDLSIEVDNAMTSIGFERTSSIDITEPNGLEHKVIRYEGYINVETFTVYQ